MSSNSSSRYACISFVDSSASTPLSLSLLTLTSSGIPATSHSILLETFHSSTTFVPYDMASGTSGCVTDTAFHASSSRLPPMMNSKWLATPSANARRGVCGSNSPSTTAAGRGIPTAASVSLGKRTNPAGVVGKSAGLPLGSRCCMKRQPGPVAARLLNTRRVCVSRMAFTLNSCMRLKDAELTLLCAANSSAISSACASESVNVLGLCMMTRLKSLFATGEADNQ
mmetsp:Transcript_18117/g.42040  ORF Transcript_18117/g.42040 Transcript_18117/m.42040 type:complete len:226 (+) Transcript_18117:653-1330(+)